MVHYSYGNNTYMHYFIYLTFYHFGDIKFILVYIQVELICVRKRYIIWLTFIYKLIFSYDLLNIYNVPSTTTCDVHNSLI